MRSYPDRAALFFQYDEPLSHLIYAAADMFVVPSMFEPCGLTQVRRVLLQLWAVLGCGLCWGVMGCGIFQQGDSLGTACLFMSLDSMRALSRGHHSGLECPVQLEKQQQLSWGQHTDTRRPNECACMHACIACGTRGHCSNLGSLTLCCCCCC